jgi:hypothetical protein
LYFLFKGGLAATTRQSSAPNINEVLDALLVGPNEKESATGVVTLLPRGYSGVSVSVGNTVTVDVPFAVKGLPRLAISQLVCTAVTTSQISGGGSAGMIVTGIIVTGTDGTVGYQECRL